MAAEQKEGKAYSRLMIADVHWHQKMYGRFHTCIANVYFHHTTAKKDADK